MLCSIHCDYKHLQNAEFIDAVVDDACAQGIRWRTAYVVSSTKLQSYIPNYLLLASLEAACDPTQMRGSELMGKSITLALDPQAD